MSHAAVALRRAQGVSTGTVARKARPGGDMPTSEGGGRLDQVLAPKQSAVQLAEEGFSGAGGKVPHLNAMNASFGADFSGVRAHAGTVQAKAACDSIGAQAYAMGDQVAFRDANPSPALVAHELTHVGQQTDMGVQRSATGGADASGIETSGEAQAEAVEAAVASGKPATSVLGGSLKTGTNVQRKKKGVARSHAWGGAVNLTQHNLLARGGYQWNWPLCPPIYPVPGFPFYFAFGASFQLNVVGTIPASTEGQGAYSVGIRGMGQLTGSARLGVPQVVSGGITLAGQVPVEGRYEKKENGEEFIGLTVSPRLRLQLDYVVGPGWYSNIYTIGDLNLFTLTHNWKDGQIQGGGPRFSWSPEILAASRRLREVYDGLMARYEDLRARAEWVRDRAAALWERVPSW